MTGRSRRYHLLAVGCVAVILGLAGCGGDDGAQGPPGEPGTSTGGVAGQVTNSLTGMPIAGVAVGIQPTVAGVSMVTDANGDYSAELPIGVYVLTFTAANFTSRSESTSVIAGGSATKNVALVPTAPVVVTTTTEGDALPGQMLTASAEVVLLDGSSLVSVSWKQKSGVAVGLEPSADGASVTVTLPNVTAFKDGFFDIVENERGALLDRYMVMGINPLDSEETGRVVLTVTVETTNGSTTKDVTVDAVLPFAWSTGLRSVPIGVPVLLHGKGKGEGAAYDWRVTPPSGSQQAALQDATTQNPYFTPDVAGKYTVTETGSGATLDIYAGKWVGTIGPDGEPTSLCTGCHNGGTAPDKFTPWKESGHAAIFTDNLNAGGHYSSACFACHTVGYTPGVSNDGFDDTTGYTDFLDQFFPGGHSPTPSSSNWTDMLASYPETARLANVQCENCHGPNQLHMTQALPDESRLSISSDVCGVCHGEPARHGRFQQWQESGHANYELALLEATVEGRGATAAHCGRCHAGQGFLAWIEQGDLTKQIQGANGNATVEELRALGLTTDTVHTQTCVVCHDPHAQGTTSGEPNTATVRISGDTPLLPAGYAAKGVGRGAICITCHNTRNGAHNDGVGLPANYSAPHSAAQGDVLMGQNAYLVSVGDRSPHSFIPDTCTTCHMELSPPPPEFSFSGSGTNHSFKASLIVCGQCHGVFDGTSLQENVEAELEDLGSVMAAYLMDRISAAGTIFIKDYTPHAFGGKEYDVKSENVMVMATNIVSLEPTEPHGQQGFIVKFGSPLDFTYKPTGEAPHTIALTEAEVQLGDITTDGTAKLIATTDPLVRSGWNYFLIHGDGSKGIHNPEFTFDVLEASKATLLTAPTP